METQRDLQSGDETPHVTTPRDGDRNHTEMAVANMAMLHPLTPPFRPKPVLSTAWLNEAKGKKKNTKYMHNKSKIKQNSPAIKDDQIS